MVNPIFVDDENIPLAKQMENPIFVDDENIPLVNHHEEDRDDDYDIKIHQILVEYIRQHIQRPTPQGK